jgi:hypothetical protein
MLVGLVMLSIAIGCAYGAVYGWMFCGAFLLIGSILD